MNKKEIICCDCSPLNFIRQVWKMWFQPSFKGVFHKKINILDWVCFFHFISTRAENLSSQRKIVGTQSKTLNRSLCAIAVFRNAVTRKNLLRKRHSQRKNRLHFTLTALDFSAWQGCTSFLANLKVCTNTKKVDNHWSNVRCNVGTK